MEEEVTVELIVATLESIVEFDPEYVAGIVGCYLLMFIAGFSTGVVIKLMKRT